MFPSYQFVSQFALMQSGRALGLFAVAMPTVGKQARLWEDLSLGINLEYISYIPEYVD